MPGKRKAPTVSEYCYGSTNGTRGTRKAIRDVLMSSEMEWISIRDIAQTLIDDYEYPETVGKTDIPLYRSVASALAGMFRDNTHHVEPQKGDSQTWRYNPEFTFVDDDQDEDEPIEVAPKTERKPRRGQVTGSRRRQEP